MILLHLAAALFTRSLQLPPDTARPPAARLTLDSALHIADSVSTTIQLGSAQQRLSGVEVLRRYGAFLPGADVATGLLHQSGTAFLSQNTTIPTNATFNSVVYHLSVGYNIFNGLQDKAALQRTLAGQDAAQWDLARAHQQVAYDVTQAFLQALLDRSLVQIAQQNLSLSETREAQLTELVRVGRRPPPDLYRQQAQTSADRASLVDANNREQDDQIALLERLRLPLDRRYDLVPPPDDTLPLPAAATNIDQLADRAGTSRPDVRGAAAVVQEGDAELRQARGERLPRVDLGFDLFGLGRVFDKEEQNGTDLLPPTQRELFSQLFPQSSYDLTLGVSWHIFDHGITRLDIARAEVDQETAQLRYDDLRIQAAADVRQAIADYTSANQRLAASQEGIVAADTAFAAIQARYDTGLSTFVDVLTTQTLLTQTRAAHAEALIQLALSKKLLQLALGGPVDQPQ